MVLFQGDTAGFASSAGAAVLPKAPDLRRSISAPSLSSPIFWARSRSVSVPLWFKALERSTPFTLSDGSLGFLNASFALAFLATSSDRIEPIIAVRRKTDMSTVLSGATAQLSDLSQALSEYEPLNGVDVTWNERACGGSELRTFPFRERVYLATASLSVAESQVRTIPCALSVASFNITPILKSLLQAGGVLSDDSMILSTVVEGFWVFGGNDGGSLSPHAEKKADMLISKMYVVTCFMQ